MTRDHWDRPTGHVMIDQRMMRIRRKMAKQLATVTVTSDFKVNIKTDDCSVGVQRKYFKYTIFYFVFSNAHFCHFVIDCFYIYAGFASLDLGEDSSLKS